MRVKGDEGEGGRFADLLGWVGLGLVRSFEFVDRETAVAKQRHFAADSAPLCSVAVLLLFLILRFTCF